jgi:uncharacterized iron-regulated membrane protein
MGIWDVTDWTRDGDGESGDFQGISLDGTRAGAVPFGILQRLEPPQFCDSQFANCFQQLRAGGERGLDHVNDDVVAANSVRIEGDVLTMTAIQCSPSNKILPDIRTIWRWHFYAGLFCVPFVLWLSTTGTIYLFKPQIEAWMDRSYDHLAVSGKPSATPEAQVKAAIAAIPGSNLHFYELPRKPDGAPQIIVGKEAEEFRVYVHPDTAAVLKIINEDDRLMNRIFHLHGEVMAGDKGSIIIELAGSWTIVLILTGLFLWWPRQSSRVAGILYPRLSLTGRLFWRDLHSVTGIWVSLFALTLLFTGLPWAKNWGGYFKKVRSVMSGMSVHQDWPTGGSSEIEARKARNGDGSAQGGGHVHVQTAVPRWQPNASRHSGVPDEDAYAAINAILPAALPLNLAYPVQIEPPLIKGGPWTVKSDSQNRMLRDIYNFDPATTAVIGHETFADRPLVDRIVSLGISVHEGHLFGWMNQVIGLFTATGVAMLAISSVVLWWRRRPSGVLGAPVAATTPPLSFALVAFITLLGITFPMLALSIAGLAVVEYLLLSRIPGVRSWLGLRIA